MNHGPSPSSHPSPPTDYRVHLDRLREANQQLVLAMDRAYDRESLHTNSEVYLLANVQDAVVATDEQMRVTTWNKAAEGLYGRRRQEVLGRDLSEVTCTDALPPSSKPLTIVDPVCRQGDQIHHHRDG